MTYYFETYGCQMNIAESASISLILQERGWKEAPSSYSSDLVIINTCSIRASAEERIYGRLGFYSTLKAIRAGKQTSIIEEKTNEGIKQDRANLARDAYIKAIKYTASLPSPSPLYILFIGCMAERFKTSIRETYPFIDYVAGKCDKNKINTLLDNIESRIEGKVKDAPLPHILTEKKAPYSFFPLSYKKGSASAFVPIMHGCNNFCSYCVVPYLRGQEVSRPVTDILKEVDFLSSYNVKEITLLGQSVCSYNYDTLTFPSLLDTITNHLLKTNSSVRFIRFLSSHPKDFSSELVAEFKSNPLLAPALHLPLQSGSNRILHLMKRIYTREQYLSLVASLRASCPSIALSTDIMTGFPGETEEDFLQTLSIVKEVRFINAMTYYYNRRKETESSKMPDLPLTIKKERLSRLISEVRKVSESVMQEYIGESVEVLVENVSKKDANMLIGNTQYNTKIVFNMANSAAASSISSLISSIVRVKITALKGNTYQGVLDY